MKTNIQAFLTALALIVSTITVSAQQNEFSISGNSNNSIIGGIAFDGTNYLAGLTGDQVTDSSVTAQRISASGQLLGNRIALGETGSAPLVAFDGNNYLIIWSDRYVSFMDDGEDAGMTNIYGRLISPAGNFIGNRFTIASGAYIKGVTCGTLKFNGNDYFFVYREDDGANDVGPVMGQRISTGGSMLGSPVQISNSNVGDVSMEFDGNNYLVVFTVNSSQVHGQLVSANAALVGSNFVIDNTNNASDNPVSVGFDGTRFLVAFHDQDGSSQEWNLYSRFVSKTGLVDGGRVMIADSTQRPIIPTLAFDGNRYLAAWVSFNTKEMRGKFINTDGSLDGSEFIIFGAQSGTLPVGGVSSFNGNKYLSICTRISWNNKQQENNAANLGIYGKFVDKSTPSAAPYFSRDNSHLSVYPNPASSELTIKNVTEGSEVRLYDLTGKTIIHAFARCTELQLDLDGLPVGVYLLTASSYNTFASTRIVITE